MHPLNPATNPVGISPLVNDLMVVINAIGASHIDMSQVAVRFGQDVLHLYKRTLLYHTPVPVSTYSSVSSWDVPCSSVPEGSRSSSSNLVRVFP